MDVHLEDGWDRSQWHGGAGNMGVQVSTLCVKGASGPRTRCGSARIAHVRVRHRVYRRMKVTAEDVDGDASGTTVSGTEWSGLRR
jgi:hypothetical protein